jgi:hypothetical protein
VVYEASVTLDAQLYDAQAAYEFELAALGVDSVETPDWLDDVPANVTRSGPPQEQPRN